MMRGLVNKLFLVLCAIFVFANVSFASEKIGIITDTLLTPVNYYNAYFRTPEFFAQDVRGALYKRGIEVVSVDESPIYGIVVTIKHENDLYTEYSSLSEATVSAGNKVSQGDVIGVSGVCEYDSALESHVFFKVMTNDKTFNPTEVVGKTTREVFQMTKVYSAE
jgi:hypothetical protein